MSELIQATHKETGKTGMVTAAMCEGDEAEWVALGAEEKPRRKSKGTDAPSEDPAVTE